MKIVIDGKVTDANDAWAMRLIEQGIAVPAKPGTPPEPEGKAASSAGPDADTFPKGEGKAEKEPNKTPAKGAETSANDKKGVKTHEPEGQD